MGGERKLPTGHGFDPMPGSDKPLLPWTLGSSLNE